MPIERIQVEEGFLDGFDATFSRGLNVIIGERGTGKSSLIELIRFCLAVPGYTAESGQKSLNHALSILGGGRVTLTLTEGEREILVTRSAAEDSPRASAPYDRPIIFSQTEIETVGLQADGRLRLLDSFVAHQRRGEGQEQAAISTVRSITIAAEGLRREIDELADQVELIPALDEQIAQLAPQERGLEKISAEAKEKKTQLDAMSAEIAASAVGAGAIERFHRSVTNWESRLTSTISAAPVVEAWPEGGGMDPLAEARAKVALANTHLAKALAVTREAAQGAATWLQATVGQKLAIEDRARQLRTEIETLQAGAGAIVRQGQQLRERRAQLESLKSVLAERRTALESQLTSRGAALDELDTIREQRFSARTAAARELTATLGPRIRVSVSRAGQFDAFAAAIADVLRGSGLRYNDLSSSLAKSISPRELLEVADANNIDFITDVTDITTDRAARVLLQLRQSDLGALATVSVEDQVKLELLDGADYKGINELSTGQRCTVVLPLILRHTDRILIVDQPEDHIDNAFIAETLIASILARGKAGQMIFSTHNANIPVLGDADRVIQLGSDGRRGYPLLAAPLEDAGVVKSISTVMEGGLEAFGRRAEFYRGHEAG